MKSHSEIKNEYEFDIAELKHLVQFESCKELEIEVYYKYNLQQDNMKLSGYFSKSMKIHIDCIGILSTYVLENLTLKQAYNIPQY